MKLKTTFFVFVVFNLLNKLSNGAKIKSATKASAARFQPYAKPSPNFTPPGGWKPGTPYKQRIPVTGNGKPGRKTNSELRNVNSDGAMNNCVYCTAAGIGKTTTNKLTNKPGPMYVDAEYMRRPDVSRVIQQSGYPNSKMSTFESSKDVLKNLNQNIRPGQSKTFGLVYQRPENRHMVALKAWKDRIPNAPVQTRVIDFQQPKENRFKDRAVGNSYDLYDMGRKRT